jgi:hypothetical protein
MATTGFYFDGPEFFVPKMQEPAIKKNGSVAGVLLNHHVHPG